MRRHLLTSAAAPLVLWIALAATTAGCSGSGNAPTPFALQLLEPIEGPRAERSVILGDSELARIVVKIAGNGSARLTARHESGAETTLLEVEAEKRERRHEATLPGAGARVLMLSFEGDPGVRWTDAEVITPLPRGSGPSAPPAVSLEGRDLILFVADSLGARHLSCYGYERDTSPTLDRLAAEGTRFATAYSQTSWTLPSVASLFTSQEQERHGLLHMEQRLDGRLTTLAELFAERGYRTVGLTQNGVIWTPTGLDRGFDAYEVFYWHPEGMEELLARAHEELDAPDREPLFLYVHLIPPHQPYEPPEELVASYADPGYQGEVDGSLDSANELNRRKPDRSDPDVRQLEALYDAHVRYADDVLGRLLQPVLDRPSAANLVLIATSDHGEAFFEHGVQGHNTHVYEEMVRIPLVFWAPASDWPAGRVVEEPASLLDILPTCVDVFGLGTPSQAARGRSLAPELASPELAQGGGSWRPLFITSRHSPTLPRLHRAVRQGPYKLVLRTSSEGETTQALYDLRTDPLETEDLSDRLSLRATAMRDLLERWDAAARAEGLSQASAPLDPERRAAIEALGYGGQDSASEDEGEDH